MQRYLRPDLLEKAGINDFDTWAATFGQVVTEMEMTVAGGDSFKMKERFAKFQNVPELLKMFHTFADVKTADDLKLPVPDIEEREDGRRLPRMVTVEPSIELEAYIADIADRAEKIQARLVDPTEDNMLKISSDGRKAALDMRLVDPDLDAMIGETKISATADLLAEVYEENKDRVYADPETGDPHPTPGALQIVFCDLGTPSDKWNVYGQLREDLVQRGVPAEKVRFAHEAKNDAEKGRLFEACRTGTSPCSSARHRRWVRGRTCRPVPCTWSTTEPKRSAGPPHAVSIRGKKPPLRPSGRSRVGRCPTSQHP